MNSGLVCLLVAIQKYQYELLLSSYISIIHLSIPCTDCQSKIAILSSSFETHCSMLLVRNMLQLIVKASSSIIIIIILSIIHPYSIYRLLSSPIYASSLTYLLITIPQRQTLHTAVNQVLRIRHTVALHFATLFCTVHV